MSPKRWSNMRSDLAAAIDVSGLRPMLRTAGLPLAEPWVRILAPADRGVRHGLSRFARWASLRRIRPVEVDDRTIELFIAELDAAALVRNLRQVRRTVARCWNSLAMRQRTAGLRPVTVPASSTASTGITWRQLPAPFREDVEEYLVWAAVPDPLAEGAREKALAPSTLALRRTQIQVAARAAVAAGIPVRQLTSLRSFFKLETFRAILRQRWQKDGSKLNFFTNNLAETLTRSGPSGRGFPPTSSTNSRPSAVDWVLCQQASRKRTRRCCVSLMTRASLRLWCSCRIGSGAQRGVV